MLFFEIYIKIKLKLLLKIMVIVSKDGDFTDQLAFDLIDQIIEKTGYSVQYTKYFLGL